MMNEPLEERVTHRRVRVRAVIALFIGLILSGAISYTIQYLQHDRYVKSERSLAKDLSHLLENTLAKKARTLAPISAQVLFEEEKPGREAILKRLSDLSPLLSNYSNSSDFTFMSWVPVWVGRNKKGSEDILVVEEWQKETVFNFLLKNSAQWEGLVTKPNSNESIVLGVDMNMEKGTGYLVVGQPFFQDFDLAGGKKFNQQFPLGYLMAWIDLSALMRVSWDQKRDPSHLLYLKTLERNAGRFFLSYQSGVTEVVSEEGGHPLYPLAQTIEFSLGGKQMVLASVALEMEQGGIFANLHWIVFAIGSVSTLLWSFLMMRISQHSDDKTPEFDSVISVEDYDRKLAREAAQRRVAEDVLRVNEARWHYVVDNLPVALFAVDNAGMFTLGEGKGLSALGLEAGSVEGNSIFEIFKDHQDLINAMRECLGGEEVHDKFEIRRHYFDMRFSPVLKPDGGFEGMICVATDVTAEYNIQERLDKVNLHLRGLMDNLPTGVAFVRGGIVQWCSRNLEELFGYEHNELSGRSPEILYFSTQSFREIEEEARECLLSKKTFNCRTWFKMKDTSRFIGEMTGRLVDPQNLHAGTMWVIQDMTRLLEEQKERRLSKAVFNNIVEGVMVCNGDNQITSVNKAFTSITGYTGKEVVGHFPSFLNSGRHPAEFFSAMWRDLQKNKEWEGEIWNRRKNGEDYLQWTNIKALEDEDGNVEEYISVFNDITKHRRTQEQLNYQSNYDTVTGLPNRHLLADRFTQAAAQAKREEKEFALVYLDLDNFKYLNESLGHECGDQILKLIAKRLDHALRSSDTVARIGGDEFIMLLMGTGQEDAVSRAVAKLSVELSSPLNIPDHEDDIIMSASCGIAIYPSDGESLAELTRKADAALDHAKKTERGLFMFFTEEMNVRAQERLQLEHKLRRALERDELILHYQPKVDVHTRKIYGAEALIRWIDPEIGMIGPDKFIPIAEETGMIIPIGEWVFKTACSQFKEWSEAGLPISNIAVNLSGRQFTKPDLAHELIGIIHEVGIDPTALEIEITESFIANNDTKTIQALDMFAQAGVKLSVDDFGTGYSSMNYLHRFPLDVMKIDRTFIMHIGEDGQESSGNLAKAIIAIGQSMNLRLVGEGVENEAQLNFLKENGCDLIQGYYFSRPLPADQFEKLLQAGGKL